MSGLNSDAHNVLVYLCEILAAILLSNHLKYKALTKKSSFSFVIPLIFSTFAPFRGMRGLQKLLIFIYPTVVAHGET